MQKWHQIYIIVKKIKANVVKSANVKSSRSTSTKTKSKAPTVVNPNGDYRSCGLDGKATTDTDYSHPDHHPDLPIPHAHDWSWNGDTPSRGPAYDPNVSKIIVDTTITVGSAYLLYSGIRMLPSLIPTFWWTIPANIATPQKEGC